MKTRPYTYNTGTYIPGTKQVGNIAVATGSTLNTSPSSWYMGPNEDTGYVICAPNPNIVQKNILLNLDAGNINSYPGTGTTWTDLSSNNINGTLVNSPSYSSSNKGYLIFDGVNDGIDCGNSSLFDLTSGLTINAWVYVINYGGGGFGRIVDRGAATTTGYWFGVFSSQSGFAYVISTGANYIYVNNSVTLNTWINICVTHKGNTAKMYKDGALIGSSSTIPSPPSASTNLYIGNRQGYDRTFNGYISNVSIYNRELSGTEILKNYNTIKYRYI